MNLGGKMGLNRISLYVLWIPSCSVLILSESGRVLGSTNTSRLPLPLSSLSRPLCFQFKCWLTGLRLTSRSLQTLKLQCSSTDVRQRLLASVFEVETCQPCKRWTVIVANNPLIGFERLTESNALHILSRAQPCRA
ncbi:uncharacterized protein K444DRAFT_271443 [Hyaloscypha bicolor E]|jgi:hypothetical protein|uniref:Uncharacterized protein n=1 Tax=Hyaloscypha bicolor E TaxID=1095630 RepID=A0A2J6SIF1_9HELO|nr:uncharacterized protein K444DRAFT_271443 [Hyaloscypha bicolor E]PMD50544.1 hypothetical protein K444DRAFT_271443 [Hyaloscypha bicolor E]